KNEDLIKLNNDLFYPNPSAGILFSEKEFEEIKIFNSLGQEIKNTSGNKINLIHFSKGIYFIKTEKGIQKINLITN
ncbi:MAG: T9SS type A sorting domain-containing protein, partial [Saprospiraceae bacterium]